jgi:hypothetical protein
VGALRAVEAVRFGVDSGGGRVGGWVGDGGCFAVCASVERVQGVEDECGGCCEQDVAVARG